MAIDSDEQHLTEYERRRLDNIKRNAQMMSSLKIESHLSDLSAISRSQKRKYTKRSNSETLDRVATRHSLRTRGEAPQTLVGLPKRFKRNTFSIFRGPLPLNHAYHGNQVESHSYRPLIQKLTAISRSKGKMRKSHSNSRIKLEEDDAIDVGSLRLDPRNVAHLVNDKMVNVKFLPTANVAMVVAASKCGYLGFWNLNEEGEDGSSIHVFRPHLNLISGISVHPFDLSKLYTSCRDGLLRLMDTEKEMFDLLYSSDSDSELSSLAQHPNNANTICFAEGDGYLNMFDTRARKISSSCGLHNQRISSIDFSPADTNIMATSSRDGLIYIWDLRKMDGKRPVINALQKVTYRRAVCSAYFSPSGGCLAITGVCGNTGVLQGANFEEFFTIHRDNQTAYPFESSRAVWGWDDTYLYVGSMERKVEVVSVKERKIVHSLDSPLMSSAVTTRIDAHPCVVGMLASSTSDGQVYVWTSSS